MDKIIKRETQEQKKKKIEMNMEMKQKQYRPVSAVTLRWFNSGVDGVFGGGGALSVEPGCGWGTQRGPVAVLAHGAQQHLCELPRCRLGGNQNVLMEYCKSETSMQRRVLMKL